jgi:GntR family transcriptional regulator
MNIWSPVNALKLSNRTIPRYTQIAGLLRAQLEAGQFQRGSCLPSIDQLSAQFEVAPQTMRQAIGVLEDEGLVLRKQGVGTLVQAVPRDLRWLSLPTDWASLLDMLGRLEPERTLMEESDRRPDVQTDGTVLGSYKYFQRIHAKDRLPFCLIEIYLASEIFLQAPRAFREGLVIPTLAKLNAAEIADVQQSLRLDVANAKEAGLLEIPMAGPVARVRRTIKNSRDEIIYLADAVYRGDVIALEMDLSPVKNSK